MLVSAVSLRPLVAGRTFNQSQIKHNSRVLSLFNIFTAMHIKIQKCIRVHLQYIQASLITLCLTENRREPGRT